MSKRKREATEGESASINGLKKARKHQRNGGHEEGAEDNDIVAPNPSASLNGHAIVPRANMGEERLAVKLAMKQARKEKRKREKEQALQVPVEGNGILDTVADASKKSERRSRAAKEKPAVKEFKDSAWRVSDPVGGRLLDLDPVFSPDEKYVSIQSPGSYLQY